MKLFKKAAATNLLGEYNPFVKPGDIVCLRNRSGKYKVVNTGTDNLKLCPTSEKNEGILITCGWSDFAGWRSR